MENKGKNTTPTVNRAAYITILTLLAVMAVLVVMTSSANRARREDAGAVPPESTHYAGTTPPLTTMPSVQTTAPETTRTPETTALPASVTTAPVTAAPAPETDAPSAGTDKPASAELAPTLLLPVSGNLTAAHDLELQVWSDTMSDYRTHCGIDIAAAPGASVCSAADGVIAQIWEDPMMGQCMSVKHAGDLLTVYRNLSPYLPVGIAEGTAVRAGQLIANIGESAMVELAEEPHLHFEVMLAGEYVNPLDHLSDSVKTSLSADSAYEG